MSNKDLLEKEPDKKLMLLSWYEIEEKAQEYFSVFHTVDRYLILFSVCYLSQIIVNTRLQKALTILEERSTSLYLLISLTVFQQLSGMRYKFLVACTGD